MDIISLSDRVNEAYTEILLMTSRVLTDVLNEIRRNIHVIVCVSESVAYLDLIWNFSYIVTQHDNYVRTDFSNSGPLLIKEGRHPIKEKALEYSFVAVFIYLKKLCTNV